LWIIAILAMQPIEQRNSFEPDEEIQSWPGLLAKLFVDFTKVVEAEARLARASIEPTLTAVLDHWLFQIVAATLALIGCLLLLAAAILLLHRWMEWWEAFGVVGAATVLLAIICGWVGRG
jgi:hypothetical protein